MYSDIDDMLALAMLHALQDRGEIKVLAVTIGTRAKWTAPYVDLIDTFYGHATIPIGIVHDGITADRFTQKPFDTAPQPYSPNGINYTQYLSQLTDERGSLVYPHRLLDSNEAEEAVRLLRKSLSRQPDHSVVLIQVGYSTDFARLLDSPPYALSPLDGIALVRHKVRLQLAMAGNYGPRKRWSC